MSITDYELANLKEQVTAQATEIARLAGALEERRDAFRSLNKDDLRLSDKYLKLREELKEEKLESEGWRLMAEQRSRELEMALDEKKEAFLAKDIEGWRARCWRAEEALEKTNGELATTKARAEKAEASAVVMHGVLTKIARPHETYGSVSESMLRLLRRMAKDALDEDPGRVLLAEFVRLREENMALRNEARVLPPAREKAMRDMMLSNNAAVSELTTAKAALGLAHAAIHQWLNSGGADEAERGFKELILDTDGRAAARYVGALEREHDAAARKHKVETAECTHPYPPDYPICPICNEECLKVIGEHEAAHAAVEELRGKP